MKTLNIFFGIIAIILLSIGLSFLFSQDLPTAKMEKLFFGYFFLGMVATVVFLATGKKLKTA